MLEGQVPTLPAPRLMTRPQAWSGPRPGWRQGQGLGPADGHDKGGTKGHGAGRGMYTATAGGLCQSCHLPQPVPNHIRTTPAARVSLASPTPHTRLRLGDRGGDLFRARFQRNN